MGTPYGEQLARKQASLRAALAGFPQLRRLTLEAPVGSPRPLGYRNQAKLVLRNRKAPDGGREVALGVYRPGTHSVAPAEACAVHDPRMRPILRSLHDEVERLEIPILDERSREGSLRYALARSSTSLDQVHLTLVSATERVPRLDELCRVLRRHHPRLTAMFLCVNPTPGNVLLSGEIRALFGPRRLLERFGRLELESRPDAFVQANVAVATSLYRAAERWLRCGPGATVLDLYCGVGALGLMLARQGSRVVGIEASQAAVDCATSNGRRTGAGDARFVCGRAEDTARIAAELGLPRPDVLCVNPPRKGLTAEAIEAAARLAPSRILYVSCNPESLARDLAALLERGYQPRRVQAFDMLPQTPHVEVLALLERDPSFKE